MSFDQVWERKGERYFKRRVNQRELRKLFLIVCEGEKTEPNYFEQFRLKKEVREIHGIGAVAESLVKKAIDMRNSAARQRIKFDQVWCVFDRDSNPPDIFNRAFELAKRENINIAYSNEAFELWYFLHFHYLDTGISRHQYIAKLSAILGGSYKKNDISMYEKLLPFQQEAIKRAKKLLSCYPYSDPCNDKPSTTVHLLVEELNKYSAP